MRIIKILFLLVFFTVLQFTGFAQIGDADGTRISKSMTPSITISLNGKEGGGVDSSEVAAWDSIVVINPLSFGTDSMYAHVHSYKCVVQLKSVAVIFYSKDAKISSELKEAISRCQNRDLIVFFDIKVSGVNKSGKMYASGPVFRFQE